MEIDVKREIAAVVTLNPAGVAGGAPVFVARNEEERTRMTESLSAIMQGVVHDLGNGITIIVKH